MFVFFSPPFLLLFKSFFFVFTFSLLYLMCSFLTSSSFFFFFLLHCICTFLFLVFFYFFFCLSLCKTDKTFERGIYVNDTRYIKKKGERKGGQRDATSGSFLAAGVLFLFSFSL